MIFYVGNFLSKFGFTPTSVETLGKFLGERYHVIRVSDKRHKVNRMIHMLSSLLSQRKNVKLVLIDTYSSSNFYYAFCAGLLSRILKIPYIPILRGGNLPHRLERSNKLAKILFKHALINVAPSDFLYQAFKSHGFSVLYIPNNVEISKYPFKQRSALAPKILWVRSFHQIYNPELAVEIIRKLRDQNISATLCMIGPEKDGSMQSVQDLIEQYQLGNQVTLTGKLEKFQWIELAEDYDIFINTTNFDNFPVSVMEAMALGIPVVSTNVGGMANLIENRREGLLVKPNDPQAFVDSINLLLNDASLANQISSNARSKAENFDWQTIKLKWFELIDPVLNS